MKWLTKLFHRPSYEEQIRIWSDERNAALKKERAHIVQAIDLAITVPGAVSAAEADALLLAANQLVTARCSSIDQCAEVSERLNDLWNPPPPDDNLYLETGDPDHSPNPDYSPPQPKREWALTLTDDFVKCTKGIDRKLQGRILEALLSIANAPTHAQGDTVKPLTGDLSGLWRYRLGDFRLIYKPDRVKLHVFILSFGPRGGAYQ